MLSQAQGTWQNMSTSCPATPPTSYRSACCRSLANWCAVRVQGSRGKAHRVQGSQRGALRPREVHHWAHTKARTEHPGIHSGSSADQGVRRHSKDTRTSSPAAMQLAGSTQRIYCWPELPQFSVLNPETLIPGCSHLGLEFTTQRRPATAEVLAMGCPCKHDSSSCCGACGVLWHT